MAFFRSPLFRRILYVIAFGLALVRFANHAHSELLAVDEPKDGTSVTEMRL